MFTTTSTYFLMLFLIIWSYSGYIIILLLFSTLSTKGSEEKKSLGVQPRVAIFIPCFNEEGYVRQKVENVKQLQYEAGKLEVYFLHGLSTDNTSAEIAKLIEGLHQWHLIETNCIGKINQLNYGLSLVRENADIIVNTDMDALLSSDVLMKMVNEFNSDERIFVVGANISPQNCLPIEEEYWKNQNLLRIIESDVYASSIVVAPCYAFKSFLIDRFPEDCIADDIYVAFKANTDGYLTKYLESARGEEIRNPSTFADFFRHKFRKGNAYLTEVLRFIYRLPAMSSWWKVIYITKAFQLIVMPWVLPFFLLSTISLALSGSGLLQLAVFGLILLLISLVFASILLRRKRVKYFGDGRTKGISFLSVFIISNLILLLVGLSYPFYRQTSSFKKVGAE